MAAPQFEMTSLSRNSIDYKANGEVSRMRSHKGNMPSLPQTKYCTLCPAKFTRTTHLNRHLRSHTNERSHRCDTCNAEFTRSDLLTRHKRTCGDLQNTNRSRRKSCQSCAESKIKCDLQYPCSKCASRGRECIFINDPETSRNKKLAAAQRAAMRTTPRSTGSATPIVSPLSSMPTTPSKLFTNLSSSGYFSTSVSPTRPGVDSDSILDLPQFAASSSSSSASSTSSPRSDFFDNQLSSYDLGLDALTLDSHLNKLYSTNLFEPFLEQSFTSPSPEQSSGLLSGDFGWTEGQDFYANYSNLTADELAYVSSLDAGTQQYPTQFSDTILLATPPAPLDNISNISLSHAPCTSIESSSAPFPTTRPSPSDLQQYLYLFFSAFSTQVPILHSSTWKVDGKPPILILAMQACGALFVKTRTALNFINDVLSSTRDTLIQEFTKNPSDSNEQMDLIMAVVLLQTIGLFHQQADQRVSSNVYHGMLVMMIRRSGLLNRVASWTPADFNASTSLDTAWREWTTYESIKRALFLSYLHDCCHCMYFSLTPSFQPTEFDISLPCDDILWRAGSAQEWMDALRTPSPYGLGKGRLTGVGMQNALAALTDGRPMAAPLPLNPFAHFILIHSILRDIYAYRAEQQSRGSSDLMTGGSDGGGKQVLSDAMKESIEKAQIGLQNWLHSWLTSPESMHLEKNQDEPPFVCNALPFYWLAQVSLLSMQEGASPTKALSSRAEGRYRLMKQWLDHIRSFLRRGDQIPSHLWEELMKIRLQVSQSEGNSAAADAQDGLLGFFPGQ
ncbi:hypothetical protein PC9H_011053 [Pleurotus ostreatus]|uniref:Uncharacterized protein n=2 Tax=Pleurotus TaxID=5320 RepID=A0A8H6ZNY2_PLEOS|nr:uncharacterized protein PC9H_011053 [Pleurotus ostreatus]KAF7422889.1 hypothetical protein PC9H_011053 [Pleurotus ostreatus]KAG9227263.1 hypothetical protein CCMSSC00406_0004198 [Pleurotus cornucopiae]